MEIFTDELILRTVTESDIDEIVRMWNYPNEETLENAYQALEYMQQTHKIVPKLFVIYGWLYFTRKSRKELLDGVG